MKPSLESLLEQIKEIGVEKGDVIFITADLLRVGFFIENRRETMAAWVNILLQAVGDEGTIVAAAYTKTFSRFKKNPEVIFNVKAQTDAGSLSTAMLTHPKAVRSLHPTNSCVAIGRMAQEILSGHDQNSLSYSVLAKVLKYKGKHLMLGTIDKKNAPLGLHYAQELIGLTKTEPSVGLRQAYYIDQVGRKRLFTRWDAGGCSGGGYKMYGHLIIEDAIKFSTIGSSISALIDAEKSTSIAISALKRNSKSFICDDGGCRSCNGRLLDDGVKALGFYINKYLVGNIRGYF